MTVFWLLFFQVGATERASYFTSRKFHVIPFKSSFYSIKLAIYNNFEEQHKGHFRYITLRNILGNMLLFIPWGFLAPMFFSKVQTLKRLVFSTILISVSAEILQFLFVVGVADIDDVLFNIVGALIGFYIFTFSASERRKIPNVVTHLTIWL